MKTVYRSSEIPHLWAHQTQDHARNSNSSLFFNGPVIYSYGSHFPIAVHVKNVSGEHAVLFTTASYSNTTAGHIACVRRAVWHMPNVFDVDLQAAATKGHHGLSSRFMDDTRVLKVASEFVPDYEASIKSLAEHVAKTRKEELKVHRLSELESLIEQANRFCAFFYLPNRWEVPSDFATIRKQLAEARKAVLAMEKAQQAEILKANAELIERWLSGENVRLPYLSTTYLRVEDSEVVTSLGARFPVSHAARALKFIRAVRESGKPYQRNGHSIHLGHYTIDQVKANGDVKAGCHYVAWEQIERIAGQIEEAERRLHDESQTCGCGLYVHPLRYNPDAIHCSDCEYTRKEK